MSKSDTDDGGDDTIASIKDSLDYLDSKKGQAYITADYAHTVLLQFHDPDGEELDSIDGLPDRIIMEEATMAGEARGLTSVYAYEPLVTVSDLSERICELLGLPTSDYHAAGGGYTLDGRHDENMETLTEWYTNADRVVQDRKDD